MSSTSKRVKIKIERCVLCGPKSKIENVAHFNFPKTKYADDWKSYCMKIDHTKPIFPSSKLCCIHFTEESLSSTGERHTLKKDAIPSIIPNYKKNFRRKCHHYLIDPKATVKTRKKNDYDLHKYTTYCLLCKSRKTDIASFHFPKDEHIRKQWMEFCQVDSTRIKRNSRLCHYHFTDDNFNIMNCGRVRLKRGTIPSIREIDFTKCKRNKKEKQDMQVEEIVTIVDPAIPPKELKLCSEIRYDETADSSASPWEDDLDNVSMATISTTEILQLGECSLCKMIPTDFVQFRFANNTAMRSVLTTYCGMSPSCLDEIDIVCISHFDDDDIYVDDDGNKMIRDGAFPWCYFSQMIAKSSNNILKLPIAEV